MDIKDFTTQILEKFTEQLTDQVFLFIENDRELMSAYLHTVEEKNLNYVNSEIAKAIKAKFVLDVDGECKAPQSKLIQGYTKFTK